MRCFPFICFVRPACKIVAKTSWSDAFALFCCASSSFLHLPPAAVAFVTQSRHSSQTELHLDLYTIIIYAVLPVCLLRSFFYIQMRILVPHLRGRTIAVIINILLKQSIKEEYISITEIVVTRVTPRNIKNTFSTL